MNLTRKFTQEQKLRMKHKTSALAATGPCLFLLVVFAFTTSSCGGGSSSSSTPNSTQVGGNWQFSLSTTGHLFCQPATRLFPAVEEWVHQWTDIVLDCATVAKRRLAYNLQ